jgi:hypothetical protein
MRKSDIRNPRLKALFYGQAGSTKTRTAASAVFHPDFAPVLMLEARGNPLSIRDYDPQPTLFSVDSFSDYSLVYDFLYNDQPNNHEFRRACADAGIPLEPYYKTVILDGTTQTQRLAFRVIIPNSDVDPGTIPNPHEIQHFNRVLDAMIVWADKFLDLPLHVIVTSLEDERTEKSGATKIRPLIWGQSRGEVCGYAYLVMRLAPVETIDVRSKAVFIGDKEEADASNFVGFCRATSTFYAKDQYGMRNPDGSLMRYMFDPTIEKIWESILEVIPEEV